MWNSGPELLLSERDTKDKQNDLGPIGSPLKLDTKDRQIEFGPIGSPVKVEECEKIDIGSIISPLRPDAPQFLGGSEASINRLNQTSSLFEDFRHDQSSYWSPRSKFGYDLDAKLSEKPDALLDDPISFFSGFSLSDLPTTTQSSEIVAPHSPVKGTRYGEQVNLNQPRFYPQQSPQRMQQQQHIQQQQQQQQQQHLLLLQQQQQQQNFKATQNYSPRHRPPISQMVVMTTMGELRLVDSHVFQQQTHSNDQRFDDESYGMMMRQPPLPPKGNPVGLGLPLSPMYPRGIREQLSPKSIQEEAFDGFIYQVRFKRSHRNFVICPTASHNIQSGMFVKVEADRGEDLGIILKKIPVNEFEESIPTAGYRGRGYSSGQGERKLIYRPASTEEKLAVKDKLYDEERVLEVIREKVAQRKLPMQILDAEYQFDRHKLTFYFEADRRIDFRELVSDLFSLYKTRIWMQQVDTTLLPPLDDPGHVMAVAAGFLPPNPPPPPPTPPYRQNLIDYEVSHLNDDINRSLPTPFTEYSFGQSFFGRDQLFDILIEPNRETTQEKSEETESGSSLGPISPWRHT